MAPKRWFGRREQAAPSADQAAEPARSPELQEAWSALRDEQFDRAISLASQHLHRPAPLGTEATKLVGLAEFRKADYRASIPRMEHVARLTNKPEDWFNFCTSATMAGEIEIGLAALDQAISALQQPHAQSPISMPQMRFHFAQALVQKGEFELALKQIGELRKIYEQLRITDDTFVYIRGVPMLPHTMEVALSAFRGLGQVLPAREWISEFASRVDEDGARYLSECAQRLEGAS
jgi:tetratricopeptide (TPR) repeat protein